MASVITRGLSLIAFGDLAVDGGPATTFTALGKTLRDTCEVMQEDPEIQEFYTEEDDDPFDRSITRGKTMVNLSVVNPDLDALVALLGGTITGTGNNRVYNAPATFPIIEKSVKVTPIKGHIIVVNRVSIVATLDFKANRKDVLTLTIKGTGLVPTKAGVPIWNTALPA